MPLIGKLKTDHEVGTEKRERGKNEAHAIGASRQITAFPLLGLVEKDQKATSRVYHVNRTVLPEALKGSNVYIGAWGSYVGLQNDWYNTETKGRNYRRPPYLTRGYRIYHIRALPGRNVKLRAA